MSAGTSASAAMAFRRIENRHDWWTRVVSENAQLLRHVPPSAIATEAAFRDYVTKSVHRGTRLEPTVFALDCQALDDLWDFIQRKAPFDMIAESFDDFNAAFRARRPG